MSYYKGSRRRSRKRSNLGSEKLGVSNVNSSETSYVSLKIHNSTALSQYTMPQYYRKNAVSSLNIGRHSVGEIIGRLNSKIGGSIV